MPRIPKKKQAPKPDRDVLHHLYIEKGLPVREIAAQLGRSTTATAWWIKRQGLQALLPEKERRTRNQNGPGYGENHHSWVGGRFRNTRGYIVVLDPDHPNATKNGYILEHRKVMSEKLGRPLLQTEVVHHIDGNIRNNNPSNLELCANQTEHQKNHHQTQKHVWTPEGRAAQQLMFQQRRERTAAIRSALKIYVERHNVSWWFLSREVTYPKAARDLLKKDLAQGLVEHPPSYYLERAAAHHEQPIPELIL